METNGLPLKGLGPVKLKEKTIDDLRKLCSTVGISYKGKNKDELVESLLEYVRYRIEKTDPNVFN
jgi:hypothetical protein